MSSKQRILGLAFWGLVTASVGGCGSCGQGSSATDDGTEDARPSVFQMRTEADGGHPIRIRCNVPLIHVDAAGPP